MDRQSEIPPDRDHDEPPRPSWPASDLDSGNVASPIGRPRISRHSSLPRALFGGGSSSLFGSSPSQEHIERPLVNITRPSDDGAAQSPSLLSAFPSSPQQSDTAAEDDIRATVDRRRLPKVEKDVDDPTTPPNASRARRDSTTLTTLSRLFAVQAATSPENSRSTSFIQPVQQMAYKRSLPAETTALPSHLYTKGLLEGRHSDITINAFGRQYKLHRLILDRAPFFASALSEPWLEANARDMTVRPEEIDTSITQSAFELALKRLYGFVSPGEEDADAIGLFATGCWLEMQDLIDSSIEAMLRQMTPATLSPLIKLMTSNYYGRAGDKILASAKAMLCRDGWTMPIKYWEGIPGEIIREIVGGDGFFIDGEWDRWVLAKRILDRRLRVRAAEAGLIEPGTRRSPLKAPNAGSLMAVRFDGVYRRNSGGAGRGVPDILHKWITLYTHPDVEPILVLLDEGIHYINLDFEQLQFIRQTKDCLGLPVMPEKVISNALWAQIELRQNITNARDPDMELGLSVQSTDAALVPGPSNDTTMSITSPTLPPKRKQKAATMDSIMLDDSPEQADEELDSGSWDGNGKPRKFWIPASDCNIVMGGNADPVIATSSNANLQRHANRMSSTLQPEDVQWAADFTAVSSATNIPPRPSTADGGAIPDPIPISYTHCPPFRFSAEFPNPRLLKDRKRYYSRTVFYAGSLWNIYIQKIASARSKQLGVYLHRAKERETEEVIAGTAGLSQGSVDERIGQLEREIIMRSERHEQRRRQRRRDRQAAMLAQEAADADATVSDDIPDSPEALMTGEPSTSRQSALNSLLDREDTSSKYSQDGGVQSCSTSSNGQPIDTPDSDSDNSDLEDETVRLASQARKYVPTLPHYVDGRPTIKTYFKIYSPSRGGRMLSVYESAPDRFNFSQSWGWKSSTLMLDEGLLGDEEDAPKDDDERIAGRRKRENDGRLRFSVAIGLI